METEKIYTKKINSEAVLSDARMLLENYYKSRGYDRALGDYKQELAQLGVAFGNPQGDLLIGYLDSTPIGLVAFRVISQDTVEMKRLYVSDEFRGRGYGKLLSQEIIAAAKNQGFNKMVLDTHPSMRAAQKLYQSIGFEECERYNQNPTPGIKFFKKEI